MGVGEEGRKRSGDDRATDREYEGICAGRERAGGAGGSGWGVVSGGSRISARISESSGVDGREVRAQSIQWERWREAVPDWGSGEVAGNRSAGVSGEDGL